MKGFKYFTNLPIELQVMIASKLVVKDVLSFRAASKDNKLQVEQLLCPEKKKRILLELVNYSKKFITLFNSCAKIPNNREREIEKALIFYVLNSINHQLAEEKNYLLVAQKVKLKLQRDYNAVSELLVGNKLNQHDLKRFISFLQGEPDLYSIEYLRQFAYIIGYQPKKTNNHGFGFFWCLALALLENKNTREAHDALVHFARQKRAFSLLQYAIYQGIDIDIRHYRIPRGEMSALESALNCDNLLAVFFLVAVGCKQVIKTSSGEVPLKKCLNKIINSSQTAETLLFMVQKSPQRWLWSLKRALTRNFHGVRDFFQKLVLVFTLFIIPFAILSILISVPVALKITLGLNVLFEGFLTLGYFVTPCARSLDLIDTIKKNDFRTFDSIAKDFTPCFEIQLKQKPRQDPIAIIPTGVKYAAKNTY